MACQSPIEAGFHGKNARSRSYLDKVMLFELQQVELEGGPLALAELDGSGQTTQFPHL